MQSWISFPVLAEAQNYFDHLTVNQISQIFVNNRNINEGKVKVSGKIASWLEFMEFVTTLTKKQLIRCFVNNPPHPNEKKKVFFPGHYHKQWGIDILTAC